MNLRALGYMGILGGLWLAGCNKETPDNLVKDPALALGQAFVDAYQKREWGKIFDMASNIEITENGLTKSQFESLMRAVEVDVPDIFSGAELSPLSSSRADLRYYLVRNGTVTQAEDMKGVAPGLLITIFKDGGSWKVYIVPAINGVNLYTPGPPAGRWTKLADAMELLDLPKLKMLDTQLEVSAKNLRLAAAGRISGDQIADRRDPEVLD